jgi:hypothetical protein
MIHAGPWQHMLPRPGKAPQRQAGVCAPLVLIKLADDPFRLAPFSHSSPLLALLA